MEYSVPMILGSFFLDVAMIRHNGTMFNDQICVFPEDQNKHILKASLLFCQHISFKISRDRQV